MSTFLPTLGQMATLGLYIAVGYLLVRLRLLPAESASVLSRLETYVFVPALLLGTFTQNFTPDRLSSAGLYLGTGALLAVACLLLSLPLARLCTRDPYVRSLYTYGLCFSNFGFMGNAVVLALFPSLFSDYLIFVIPFWVLIYGWGVPMLLIPPDSRKKGLRARLRGFVNPMFISMLAGMAIGLLSLPVPTFLQTAFADLGACMSPVAMLLTGMAVAAYPVRSVFCRPSVYAVSALRLLLLPLLGLVALMLLPLPHELSVCLLCVLCMPLGLNTVVIPGAYGQDTSAGAGMALVSHLLSLGTIPLMFTLFDLLVK